MHFLNKEHFCAARHDLIFYEIVPRQQQTSVRMLEEFWKIVCKISETKNLILEILND